ncbi:MAG: Do family serine endopeptidase [Chthoniobacteraceae bacterium]|nr:Do family serine endopeptidase [Chthoniobacteraceae bacterium]
MSRTTRAGWAGIAGLAIILALEIPGVTQPPGAPPQVGMTTFAPVVEKAAPSVVSIHTAKTVRVPRGLRDFFGIPGAGQERERGLGSGVIVSEDGFILTNRHVIEAADEISVRLAGGNEAGAKSYKAQKIGADPGTDIAVLKIEAKGLRVLPFADSDKARVGDIVLAVGTPFGLTQTVTMGIVSGMGRGGMGIVDYENFIQTDASINPGNSGGALVDMEGRLLGINTAIFSRTGGNQGIGFAVPSNLAQEVWKSIRQNGRVIRGYLGTVIQPVTPELAAAFGLKEPSGALVADVAPGSPAEKAGLSHGDVIVAIDGKKVEAPRELRLKVGAMAPGTKVALKYLRGGQEKEATVELGELPQKEAAIPSNGDAAAAAALFEGVELADLDAQGRNALGAPASVQGALVTEIDPECPAYRAGLRQGYVIEEIDRKPVKTAADAQRLAGSVPKGQPVLLRAWGEGQSRYFTLGGK